MVATFTPAPAGVYSYFTQQGHDSFAGPFETWPGTRTIVCIICILVFVV